MIWFLNKIYFFTFHYYLANIRYFNAFADWMSVALVAASRCITVTKPKLLYKIFSVKKYRILILCSVWIYGIILLIPTNLGVNTSNFFNKGIILYQPEYVKYYFRCLENLDSIAILENAILFPILIIIMESDLPDCCMVQHF